jgi:hypothetical protein
MANLVPGIFNRAIFAGKQEVQRRNAAAQGLSQTFAAILSRQMRQSTVSADQGPMGIAGGASGDIYGGFMDEVLGKVLAHSPAMKALNRALERDLDGPRHSAGTPTPAGRTQLIDRIDRTILAAEARDNPAVPLLHNASGRGLSQFGATAATGADNRGPLLLPPAPDSMAPDLPAPTGLKG